MKRFLPVNTFAKKFGKHYATVRTRIYSRFHSGTLGVEGEDYKLEEKVTKVLVVREDLEVK